ncbi:DNA-binding LytR/AlgR family response regulator [Fontibacillus solani]|uniref:DNA-binding LytR/AlgR family response regulator n=1 Tax=Fontibacillus solani TaxID=1572857 RepID=A0A7W3SPN8_9BACL|nr:LytTR family DNA-binding domain-containing protein [Fontibacillus solani]MBA9083940.1 DNA-binding LytR/AlgR family response regulator [Fontibacillus solani]
MIRVAICDDETRIHERLQKYFSQLQIETSYNFKIHFFQAAEELLAYYKEAGPYAFHIVIMDMEMNGMSGLEAAKTIRSFPDFDVQFILITHYPKYMLSSFEVQPFQFLVKPIEYDLFKYTFTRLCSYLFANNSRFVTMKSENGYIVMRKPEIIALAKIKHNLIQNKIKVVTIHHNFCVTGTLSECLARINEPFKLIHRSVVINLEHVRRFTATSVIMSNDDEFPIGRTQAGTVKNAFAEFIVGSSTL